VSEAVVGSKGTANPGGNIKPKEGEGWRFRDKALDPYVQEHIDLMNAIANDTELNEGKQVTDSCVTAIMGREAAYSGSVVEWNDVVESKFAYGPEELYKDPANMKWGAFRTLKPPMPGDHDIFKDKVELPTA
jgi:hypothetical protein